MQTDWLVKHTRQTFTVARGGIEVDVTEPRLHCFPKEFPQSHNDVFDEATNEIRATRIFAIDI